MATVHSFTQGKILSPLLRFSLPILVALLLQAMYGAADLLIVGQFNSSADVSAVATGSQVMHTAHVVPHTQKKPPSAVQSSGRF